MTSPADPRTGVQITRQFTLQDDSSRVMVSISFRNTTQQTIRWSIWDVVQLRAEKHTDDGGFAHESAAIITAPLRLASTFPRHFNVMFGADENPQWQVNTEQGLFEAPYLWHIGKVGLDTSAGWIAFSNPAAGFAFCQRYHYEAGAEYPDGGASAEVWTTGAGRVGNFDYESHPVYLMEAELLSPLRTIPPGETTSFSIEWGLCRADAKVREVSEGGAVIAPLRARLAGGLVHVTGTFGVFERGGLWLTWLDAHGNVADAYDLGPVDPLALVTIDRMLPHKAEYQRVLVQVSAWPDVFRTVAMVKLE